MSWAQEGREHKQKELAKSEQYAESGVGKAKKKMPKKRFGMEYRTAKEWQEHTYHPSCAFLYQDQDVWKKCWRWYKTAKQRDEAMERLSTKPFLSKGSLYEYRPIER